MLAVGTSNNPDELERSEKAEELDKAYRRLVDFLISRPEKSPSRELWSRFALQHRAAEWFKLARKPRKTWKTLEDLAAQLAEFDLRCAGQDYDTAAAILQEIDFAYLILWGYFRLVSELYERLLGKINDPTLKQKALGNLGTAYYRMGQYQRAIICYEQALSLAREQKDRWGEGVWLGNLGNCYFDSGYIAEAIEYYEPALAISREVDRRSGVAIKLSNLGNVYAALGQTTLAIEYNEQALAIDCEKDRPGQAHFLNELGKHYTYLGQTAEAVQYLNDALAFARKTGDRYAEANAQTNLGWVHLDQGSWGEAARAFTQAIEIADDTANPEFQQAARLGLAQANLYQGQFATAREMAEAAQQYDFPLSNHSIAAVLGVAVLRQDDRTTARKAFASALNQANELLTRTPQLYAALDTKGLVLCGLALCDNSVQIPAAKEVYRAARAINADAGIVGRVLQLFDALAKADRAGILAEVRAEAAGEVAS